jgi:hypothetical protein
MNLFSRLTGKIVSVCFICKRDAAKLAAANFSWHSVHPNEAANFRFAFSPALRFPAPR